MTQLQIGRYLLIDEIPAPTPDDAMSFWRGHDEVLDREVAVRLLDEADPRAAAFLGAARAAALVEDRRLLRILDILTVPAQGDTPARIAVVSEWARGHTLDQWLATHEQPWLAVDAAVAIVDDVARAVAAGLETNVTHGRLRPSSVIITDADEVRVRGLAVDAALWGQLDPSLTKEQADVDGLGSLLYLLVTGTWPTATGFDDLPTAPMAGVTVLPPSQVRADVPRHIDDCVARSVSAAARPRGVRNVANATAFSTMLGVARDHVAPTADSGPSTIARPMRIAGRGVLVLLALASVIGLALIGWSLISTSPNAWTPAQDAENTTILTTPVTQASRPAGIERILPITGIRSFNPWVDTNNNGKPDGLKAHEHEEQAPLAIDGDATTAWTSKTYKTPQLDGKPGVGLILDLGSPQSVRAVSLDFVGAGAPIDIRVAEKPYKDPGTWTPLASAQAGSEHIDIRAPRAVTGRYVLLWFPQVPPAANGSGRYQVAVGNVVVRG